MQTLKQDVLYALRTLAKSPAYAAITILTLALGIGANTAIFSVVNGVMLKPLSYPRPDRLDVHHEHVSRSSGSIASGSRCRSGPSSRSAIARSRASARSPRARSTSAPPSVRAASTPRSSRRSLLTVLGVGAAPRAALQRRRFACPAPKTSASSSYGTWQSDFGGDETVLGRVVAIDGVQTRIVGIMPPGYDIHDERLEVYLPLTIDPKTFPNSRSSHFLYMVGRLKDGVSLAAGAGGPRHHDRPVARTERQQAFAQPPAQHRAPAADAAAEGRHGRRHRRRRCGCCRARSASCCSSPAPTSRT